MASLFDRVRDAGPEEAEALKVEVANSTLPDELKRFLLTTLREREISARVDAATADETKALRAEIEEEEDSILPENAKRPLVARLDRREIEVFGNFFTLIDELFVKDEAYDAAKKVEESGEFDFYRSCCRDFPSPLSQGQERGNRQRRRSGEEVTPPAKRIMRCRTRSGEPNDVYALTYSHARQCDEAATNEGQSKLSSHAQARLTLWPTNVVGQPHATGMEIAHLVPASSRDARSYWFVADFLFGWDSRRDWDETSRLIHGSNGPRGDGSAKVANTGIKHMVTNKILLASQKDYLNTKPCVIIVPILSRNGGEVTALNWSGQAYDAIMLIDSYRVDDHDHVPSPLVQVATATGYVYYDEAKENKATPAEVKRAMDLFCDYTRAIYYAQVKRKPTQTQFSMEGEAGLFYSKLPDNYENLNVRKISFASNDSMDGHPAPDPLLLLSKSISVLQARHGFKIMAAAEPTDDVFPSDASIQAEEDFLRRREQCVIHRDPLGMDIIVG